MSAYDVYAYGMISSSVLHILEHMFPVSDGYAEIKNSYRMTGGEAANSSLVLGRLGVKVRLDGNWLGSDETGRETLKIIRDFGIDTLRLALKNDYRGVEEIVFADSATRTVFGTYCKLLFTEMQWNDPVEKDIADAQVVSLDPFFKNESLAVVRFCNENKKPYVTVDCSYQNEIAEHAAVNIISGEFIKREHPGVEQEKLYSLYTENTHGLVIITAGSGPVIFGRKGNAPKMYQPYQITPVDTAGAGDSFRAGAVYALLKGWSDEKLVVFASALGAYICESFPGVLNCPTLDEILAYMKKKGTPDF